jgi:hypothetical protein
MVVAESEHMLVLMEAQRALSSNRIVQASNDEQANAHCERADNQGDKHRRNNCEFHSRGALLVDAQGFQTISHGQPNLMSDVLLIGVGKVPLMLRPGNIGA